MSSSAKHSKNTEKSTGFFSSKAARIVGIAGIVMVVIGVIAYVDQMINGLGTTNMNNLFT